MTASSHATRFTPAGQAIVPVGLNLTQLFPGLIGGTETYARALVKALQAEAQGERFVLFCLPDNGLALTNPQFQKVIVGRGREGLPGLAYRALRRGLRSTVGVDLVGAQLSRWRPGVSVMHYPFSYLWPPPASMPAVLTLHDIQHEFHPEFFTPAELRFRQRHYPSSARKATRLIAISEFTRQTIIDRYGVHPDRVTTIYYGIDMERFGRPAAAEVLEAGRARYHLPDRFVFYPANAWPHKNHRGLLLALQWLRERGALSFKLVLAGRLYPNGPDPMMLAGQMGLGDAVIHLGYVPHADTPLIYQLALAMVFPSLFEGFGAPVIEAMACGCPVIGSNVTALPEVAGGAALLADAGEPESLGIALQRVVEDAGLRSDLARRGQERASQFSWAEAARRTLEVYRSAAAAG